MYHDSLNAKFKTYNGHYATFEYEMEYYNETPEGGYGVRELVVFYYVDTTEGFNPSAEIEGIYDLLNGDEIDRYHEEYKYIKELAEEAI